ncbi:MAG TPA: hypothetical protein VE863_06965 [Pyrinomonadaceae bacterium]|jgi:hypothetical protein|nr:hypothetical protein [Pyrinomonadaceae bacterium]
MNQLVCSAPFAAAVILISAGGSVFLTYATANGSVNTANSTNGAAIHRRWRDPYVAEWSNGRGGTLVIESSTIRFGKDKKVPYTDITRVTNGREFNLQLTFEGKLNYLTEFVHISFGDGDKTDEMKMTLYNSRKDMDKAENSQGEATWYRDK